MRETRASVNDGRWTEIVFLVVIAILIAIGGRIFLHVLDTYRVLGTVLLGIATVGALYAIRRAYVAGSASARRDVTKCAAYAAATALAFITIAFHAHWAIGAAIAAFEAALVFDIITVAARPHPTEG